MVPNEVRDAVGVGNVGQHSRLDAELHRFELAQALPKFHGLEAVGSEIQSHDVSEDRQELSLPLVGSLAVAPA